MAKTYLDELRALDVVSYDSYLKNLEKDRFIYGLASSLDIKNENTKTSWLRNLFDSIRRREPKPEPTVPETKVAEQPLEAPSPLPSDVFQSIGVTGIEKFLKDNYWGGEDLVKLPETPQARETGMWAERMRKFGGRALDLYFPPSRKDKPIEEYAPLERFQELAIGGILSAMPLPGIAEGVHARMKEADKTWEKIVFGGAHAMGFITSLAPLKLLTAATVGPKLAVMSSAASRTQIAQATVGALETKFPKIANFIFSKAGFEGWLEKTLEMTATFGLHGQMSLPISADIKDRLGSFSQAVLISPFFTTAALQVNPALLVSSNFALGFGMSKLAGENFEDSVIQGGIFATLAAAGIIRIGEPATQARIKRAMLKRATEELLKQDIVPPDEGPPGAPARVGIDINEYRLTLQSLLKAQEDGRRMYLISPERPLPQEVMFTDIRALVKKGDHQRVSTLWKEKLDGLFSELNLKDVEVIPMIGNYFGSTEGGAAVISKFNPAVEYALLQTTKNANQDTLVSLDFSGKGRKLAHPVLFIEFVKDLTVSEKERVGKVLFEKYGKAVPGSSVLGTNAMVFAFAPKFAGKLTPEVILNKMEEIPVLLRSKGFEITEPHEIVYANTTVYGRPGKGGKPGPGDFTYNERLRALRRDYPAEKLWANAGTEENFNQRASSFLEGQGLVSPWQLREGRQRLTLPEIPSVVNENNERHANKLLREINIESFLERFAATRHITGEKLNTLLGRLGFQRGTVEERITEKRKREIEKFSDLSEVYNEQTPNMLDVREIYDDVGKPISGWVIEKSRAKKDALVDPKEVTKIEVELLLEELLPDTIWKNKNFAPEERKAFIKSYFNNERDGLSILEKVVKAYEEGGDLSELRIPYRFTKELETDLRKVFEKFRETDGSLDGLVQAITGREIDVVTIGQKGSPEYSRAYREAHKFSRRLGLEDVKEFYQEIKEAFPDTFREIEKSKYAADIVKAAVTDQVAYELRMDKINPDLDDASVFKKNPKKISPHVPLTEKLQGRKELMEEAADIFGLYLFRNRKLPKAVKGRISFGKFIELQEEGAAVAFHEVGHGVEGRYNIVKNIPDALRPAIARETKPLLRGLDLKKLSAEQIEKESFAQFFTRYVLRGDTADKFPMTHDYFEATMRAANPELLEQTQRLRSRFHELREAPELAALKTEIASADEAQVRGVAQKWWKNPTGFLSKVSERVREFYRNELNVFADAKDIDKIYGKGLNEGIFWDFFTLENRQRSMVGLVLTRGFPSAEDYASMKRVSQIRFKNEGYADIYEGLTPVQIETLSAYRVAVEDMARAKRARQEGKDYPRNPFLAKGRGAMAVEQAKEQFPGVEQYAKRLERHLDAAREFAAETGLLSPEDLVVLKQNPILAHLLRMPVASNDFKEFSRFVNTLQKEAKGAQNAFQDPLWSDLAEITYLAHQGVENLTLRKLGGLVERHGNIPGLVERVAPDVAPSKVTAAEIKKWVRTYWPEMPEILADIIGNAVEANPSLAAKLWRPTRLNDADKTVAYYDEKGERKLLKLSPRLYDSLQSKNTKILYGSFWDLMRNYVSIRRALATTFSLPFAIKNFSRDAFAQFVQADKNVIPLWNSLQGFQHILQRTDIFETGLLYGLYGSGVVSNDVNDFYRSVKKVGVKNNYPWATKLFDWMQGLSESIELSSRVGLLEKYNLNDPVQIKQGILDSLNATYPWHQRGRLGAVTSIANKFFVPFFKPNLLVPDRVVATIKDKPLRTMVRLLPLTMFGLWLDEKHKDDIEYRNLPAWRRNFFLNFKVGDQILFMPSPNPYNILALGIPRVTRDTMNLRRVDPVIVNQFVKGAISEAIPYGPSTAVPAIVSPIIEAMLNVDLFQGLPIVPDHLKRLPKEMQYDKFTSDYAILVSRGLRKLGIDVAPLQIERFTKGYLLAGADALQSAGNWVLDALGIPINDYREQFDMMTIPGVKGFVAREYGPKAGFEPRNLTLRYQNVKKIYNGFIFLKKKDPKAAAALYSENKLDLQHYLIIKSMYGNVEAMVALYKTIERRTDLHPDVKKAQLKNIRQQILWYSEYANAWLDQLGVQ